MKSFVKFVMRINLVRSSTPVPTIYNTAQTMMMLTLIHKIVPKFDDIDFDLQLQ